MPSDLITRSLWREQHPRPHRQPGQAPPNVDFAVIGAGYTGLNAAREIAAAGASVVVLDSGPVGAGASSVNGGMVNVGLKAATAKVHKMFGPVMGREFWDGALSSIDLVEDLVTEHGIDCSFVRGGAAQLGYRRRDLPRFTAQAEWYRSHLDFACTVLGPDRVGEVIDSPRFRCALVDTVGAGLHPARYVDGLARVAEAAGAQLMEHTAALQVARHTAGYTVLTDRGKIDAGAVILATNGYTGDQPFKRLRRRVIPIGSYIVATEPLPTDQVERLIPNNRMMWTARRFLNYFRRTPDDRILMGGRNNLSTDLDLGASARILGGVVAEVFPELASTPITHSWTGRLGVTFDLMPHIGRIDGVWYALGYSGHGVGIATLVGTELGRLVTGKLDRSPYQEIPHPTRPYYRGEPWFLPAAARWYRLLDGIGR
ncbi:MAG: FAD-binding oxidoreductase [Actinomycetota bacterium]|nr:FAD-binding oxidoreductase [Actinomycetota bacterium]